MLYFLRLRVTQNTLQLPLIFSSFSRQNFWTDCQSVLCMIYKLLPKTHVTSTGLISLNKLKKVCVTNVSEDVICDASHPCYTM